VERTSFDYHVINLGSVYSELGGGRVVRFGSGIRAVVVGRVVLVLKDDDQDYGLLTIYILWLEDLSGRL
jgi:hypothetical protein